MNHLRKKDILDLAMEVMMNSKIEECDFDPEEVVIGFRMEYNEHILDGDFNLTEVVGGGAKRILGWYAFDWVAMTIALSHLKEIPDYYTRLVRMELEAKQ